MASVASSSNLPDAIVQEIRALLAVHGKEVVMTDLASGEKKEGQDNLLGKVFHGSSGVGGYVSLLQLFLDGKPPYASAFNKLPIENNREGNELRVGSDCILELKELLHCDSSKWFKCFSFKCCLLPASCS